MGKSPSSGGDGAGKEKDYPPFRPEKYRDHPLAEAINGSADYITHREGEASRANLGESWAYCADAYGLTLEDMPPWVAPVVCTGLYAGRIAVDVYVEKEAGAKQEKTKAAPRNPFAEDGGSSDA